MQTNTTKYKYNARNGEQFQISFSTGLYLRHVNYSLLKNKVSSVKSVQKTLITR